MPNTQLIETTEKFRQFVEKYDEAVKINNIKHEKKFKYLISKNPNYGYMIAKGYIDLGSVNKPLITGTYRVNDDCSIDIEGDFRLTNIFDYNRKPLFLVEDFPFKINKVSGNFEIAFIDIKNLDMFPRLVEGNVSLYNFRTSIEGIAGSVIKGDCIIACEPIELYFPDSVGGNLSIIDYNVDQTLHLDKTVYVGGCLTFLRMHITDPNVPKIKEKIIAKEYKFDERKLEKPKSKKKSKGAP